MIFSRSLLSSALCVLVLSSVGSASADSGRNSAQLLADYSDIPTLYSLDAQSGEIYKSVSHSEALASVLMPWVRMEHHRSPWKGPDFIYRSSSCKVSAFDLRPNKTIIAIDSVTRRLCSFDTTGTEESFWTGPPLVAPTSIAIIGNTAYIADKGANTVFAFSLDTRRFIGSYWDGGVVPDKIVGGRGQIVGVNYSARTIIQMYLIESEPASTNQLLTVGSVFRVHRTTYDGTSEPVDFGIDGDALYVLDRASSALIYVSLSGYDTATLRLEGVTADPHPAAVAVAHSDSLYLVFSKFGKGVEVVQNIRLASIYLDGDLARLSRN
jgi:hypothetical protein